MNTIVVVMVLLGAFFCQYVDANEECKEGFMKFKEALNAAVDDSECGKTLELEKYKFTDEEDREKQKAMQEEFKKIIEEMDGSKKEALMNCLDEIFKTAFGSAEGDMPEECIKKLKEDMKKGKEMMMGPE